MYGSFVCVGRREEYRFLHSDYNIDAEEAADTAFNAAFIVSIRRNVI